MIEFSFGQIVHVDNPDITVVMEDTVDLPNDTVKLDLNDDGTTDITFLIRNTTRSQMGLVVDVNLAGYYQINENNDTTRIMSHIEQVATENVPFADTVRIDQEICHDNYNTDTTIGGLGALITVTSVTPNTTQRLGYFRANERKFMGLKFYDNVGHLLYARIKVSLTEDCDSITIYSWDYEPTGKCINAANLDEFDKGLNVEFNIHNNVLNITKSNHQISKFNIYNIHGQLVENVENVNNSSYDLNLTNGIYIINFIDKDNNISSSKFNLTL